MTKILQKYNVFQSIWAFWQNKKQKMITDKLKKQLGFQIGISNEMGTGHIFWLG